MSSRSQRPRRYNRVLLKISGECFASARLLASVADQLRRIRRQTALAVVVGGGNIIRGRHVAGLDRTLADRVGMLATVINASRLAAMFDNRVATAHLCAFGIPGLVERYTVERGRAELAEGRILILSGGTGNPFFSTDSAAALRAAELGVQALLKGTNVAGVYSADPNRNARARLYRRLSYEQALEQKLGVMDLTAFALCMENRIPIHVFDIRKPKAIIDLVQGKQIGSYLC